MNILAKWSRPHFQLTLEFKPQDLWLGVYWNRGSRHSASSSGIQHVSVTDVWVCLLPCLPIHVSVANFKIVRLMPIQGVKGRPVALAWPDDDSAFWLSTLHIYPCNWFRTRGFVRNEYVQRLTWRGWKQGWRT